MKFLAVVSLGFAVPVIAAMSPPDPRVPFLDLAGETARQVVVDRQPGQYLGHPTTVLLEDGHTMLCAYPLGHGKGAIQLKRSTDGGLTWSPRLPVPDNWKPSLEPPTPHRVVDAAGHHRLIVWSGLYPARLASSDDDGATWTPLAPAGHWGGIVVMASLTGVRNEPGHYLAWFHDDGRFLHEGIKPASPPVFTIYQVESRDGGLTWSEPRGIVGTTTIKVCEPGVVRSPDGHQLALLLREESRQQPSQVVFSDDEGRTWTPPRALPNPLIGDRHTARYAPDGRLFISFRDTNTQSPTQGDWLAWVGTYDDLVQGRPGQYRVRLMDNTKDWDSSYPGVEVLPDGTIVTTTYGHWAKDEKPYIVSVRLKLSELDEKARGKY